MPDVRYLRTMISGVPVVTAPTGAGHPTVVDMTRTRFCDASGLHILLRAHKRALSEGGELRLVIPADGAVSRVIYLTSLLFRPGRGPDPTARRGPARLAALAGHAGAQAPVSRKGGQLVTAH